MRSCRFFFNVSISESESLEELVSWDDIPFDVPVRHSVTFICDSTEDVEEALSKSDSGVGCLLEILCEICW